jgi:hypothetical protein
LQLERKLPPAGVEGCPAKMKSPQMWAPREKSEARPGNKIVLAGALLGCRTCPPPESHAHHLVGEPWSGSRGIYCLSGTVRPTTLHIEAEQQDGAGCPIGAGEEPRMPDR